MNHTDTINLLMECDAGSKMAVVSIDEILEKTKDVKLKQILSDTKHRHTELGEKMHQMLTQHGAQGKDPPMMAKSMSWLKTNLKFSLDERDAVVAELITDGCNMGIKSLHEYLNKYEGADDAAKGICLELAALEEKLLKDLQAYL